MANAQNDLAPRSQGRKWAKIGITSLIFMIAVIGAFYIGSQRKARPVSDARQSLAMPSPEDIANSTAQSTNDGANVNATTDVAVEGVGTAEDRPVVPLTDRDVYAHDLAKPTTAENAAYERDNAWQKAENAAMSRASPAVKDALTKQAVSKFLCRNIGPKPDGSGPCAAQADAENRLAEAGWCFNASSDNPGAPYWHECVTAVDHLSDGDSQNPIQDASDKALARATPAVRALLEKEAAANEGCRGSSDQETIDRECAIRDRLEAALDKAGWCYGRRDDGSAADSYWHDCKW